MEPSVVETIFLPWWKSAVYIFTVFFGLVAAVIAIRITINFDLNAFLKDKKEERHLRDRLKNSEKCGHVWTLYYSSPFSRCDKCLCLISTSVLLLMRNGPEPRPLISGYSNLLMTPGEKEVYVENYVGNRRTSN